jgi:hypothetical protein
MSDEPESPLPPGLQNALGAAKRELSPSAEQIERLRANLGNQVGTGEPVELAARVRSIDEAERSSNVVTFPQQTSQKRYAVVAGLALAAGVLGYLGVRGGLSDPGAGRGATRPPDTTSALPSVSSVLPVSLPWADAAADASRLRP